MTFEHDPEVSADLARREASERDARRRRQLLRERPDPVVESWPCRTGCGAMIGQTPTGIAAWEENNALLISAGMRPMTKLEVMWCPSCRAAEERRLAAERASARPHQTEPTDDDPNSIDRFKPTPRLNRGRRPLKP